MEVHDAPERALSDGANALPLPPWPALKNTACPHELVGLDAHSDVRASAYRSSRENNTNMSRRLLLSSSRYLPCFHQRLRLKRLTKATRRRPRTPEGAEAGGENSASCCKSSEGRPARDFKELRMSYAETRNTAHTETTARRDRRCSPPCARKRMDEALKQSAKILDRLVDINGLRRAHRQPREGGPDKADFPSSFFGD